MRRPPGRQIPSPPRSHAPRRWAIAGIAVVVALASMSLTVIRAGDDDARIGWHNWGRVVAPVFGTSQAGPYAGAELFAAPKQFGPNYYRAAERADRAPGRPERPGRREPAGSAPDSGREVPRHEQRRRA